MHALLPLRFGQVAPLDKWNNLPQRVSPIGTAREDVGVTSRFTTVPVRYEGVELSDYPDYTPDRVRQLVEIARDVAKHRGYGAVAIAEEGLKNEPGDRWTFKREKVPEAAYDSAIQNGFRSGKIHTTYDFNLQNDTSLCAERLAITRLVQDEVMEGNSDVTLDAVLFSGKSLRTGKVHRLGSCVHCLDYMHISKNLTDDTLLVIPQAKKNFLGKTEVAIEVRPLKDFLPYRFEQKTPVPSFTAKPFNSLPMEVTPKARQILERRGLLDPEKPEVLSKTVSQLMEDAKKAYLMAREFGFSQRNGQYLGASTLFLSNNRSTPERKYVSGSSLHATDKLFDYADRYSLHKGLESQYDQSGKPIKRQDTAMIGYYSPDVMNPVRPLHLGAIDRITGRSDVVLVTIREGILHLRTIADYMPLPYTKKKDLKHGIFNVQN